MSALPLFLAVGPLADEGERMVLDGAEGRHAARVRRVRPGEAVMLSDGHGELARCIVLASGRDTLDLRLQHRWRERPPPLQVTLAQAPVKGERAELAVELATEAGVDAIVPWRAQRCVVRWDRGPREAKALARWRATAEQAAKQARRAVVPRVAESIDTAALGQQCRQATIALVLHEAAERALSAVPFPAAGEVVLIVGPEGGITESELTELAGAGAQPVRLGPEVLRASTAGAVALGALGALTSRWSGMTDGCAGSARRDTIEPTDMHAERRK